MGLPEKLREAVDWLQRGHFLYMLLIAIGGGTAVKALLATVTGVPHVWITPIWLLCAGLFLWALSAWGKKRESRQQVQGSSPGSQLASRSPAPAAGGLSLEKFFAESYESPLAADVSSVFGDSVAFYDGEAAKEAALLKFIGVGAVLWGYDMIWAYAYRSQILLLKKLNGGPIEIEDARGFYESAARVHPEEYKSYNFPQWLEWLRSQSLVLTEGTKIAITVRGRDFLKYTIHYGLSDELKAL